MTADRRSNSTAAASQPTPARPFCRSRSAMASRFRTSATRTASSRPATAAAAWSRSTASACSLPSCCRAPSAGMKVQSAQPARAGIAEAGARAAAVGHAAAGAAPIAGRPADFGELDRWAAARGVGVPRFPRRAQPRRMLIASGARGQPRCLHPVHPLRAGLPRRAGQRRDRSGLPRRTRADRLRPARCARGVDLRGVRRVRAGLPDRCAGLGGAARQPCGDRARGRHAARSGAPRWSIRCARSAASAARSATTSRTTASSMSKGRDGPANAGRLCVKGRYGFDYAHHPQRLTVPLIRRDDAPKHADAVLDADNWQSVFREASWDEALERAAAGLRADPRARRPARAGRLRFGQGQQRGSLSVPEAGAHRLRQQQRRPLHPAVPRLVGGGAARRHRIGCGLESGARCRAGRGGDRDRRQSGREPSGGGELHQECGRRRHPADPARPAARRTGAPCAPSPRIQARYRRRAAQRDDAHDRRGGPGRGRLHRRAHDRLRRAEGQPGQPIRPRRWRRCAASMRQRSARWRGCTPLRAAR